MISIHDAESHIQQKPDLHDSLIRNSYFIPPLKSSGCTLKYLVGVKRGEFWCPRYEHVKLRPCPMPPSKKYIFSELIRLLNGMPLGISDESKVDANWLLTCLSTICPNHEIF